MKTEENLRIVVTQLKESRVVIDALQKENLNLTVNITSMKSQIEELALVSAASNIANSKPHAPYEPDWKAQELGDRVLIEQNESSSNSRLKEIENRTQDMEQTPPRQTNPEDWKAQELRERALIVQTESMWSLRFEEVENRTFLLERQVVKKTEDLRAALQKIDALTLDVEERAEELQRLRTVNTTILSENQLLHTALEGLRSKFGEAVEIPHETVSTQVIVQSEILPKMSASTSTAKLALSNSDLSHGDSQTEHTAIVVMSAPIISPDLVGESISQECQTELVMKDVVENATFAKLEKLLKAERDASQYAIKSLQDAIKEKGNEVAKAHLEVRKKVLEIEEGKTLKMKLQEHLSRILESTELENTVIFQDLIYLLENFETFMKENLIPQDGGLPELQSISISVAIAVLMRAVPVLQERLSSVPTEENHDKLVGELSIHKIELEEEKTKRKACEESFQQAQGEINAIYLEKTAIVEEIEGLKAVIRAGHEERETLLGKINSYQLETERERKVAKSFEEVNAQLQRTVDNLVSQLKDTTQLRAAEMLNVRNVGEAADDLSGELELSLKESREALEKVRDSAKAESVKINLIQTNSPGSSIWSFWKLNKAKSLGDTAAQLSAKLKKDLTEKQALYLETSTERDRLRQDIRDVRSQTRSDFDRLRSESNSKMIELKRQIMELEQRLKASLKSEIDSLKKRSPESSAISQLLDAPMGRSGRKFGGVPMTRSKSETDISYLAKRQKSLSAIRVTMATQTEATVNVKAQEQLMGRLL
ncbi:hypothetical protein BC829DRAFT_439723 [Chytridium lagenaria]|nr:hypothetical protein BC829DRAFT_439723 [Chytridium lagenaria]